jgi:hypothetical protein
MKRPEVSMESGIQRKQLWLHILINWGGVGVGICAYWGRCFGLITLNAGPRLPVNDSYTPEVYLNGPVLFYIVVRPVLSCKMVAIESEYPFPLIGSLVPNAVSNKKSVQPAAPHRRPSSVNTDDYDRHQDDHHDQNEFSSSHTLASNFAYCTTTRRVGQSNFRPSCLLPVPPATRDP